MSEGSDRLDALVVFILATAFYIPSHWGYIYGNVGFEYAVVGLLSGILLSMLWVVNDG